MSQFPLIVIREACPILANAITTSDDPLVDLSMSISELCI